MKRGRDKKNHPVAKTQRKHEIIIQIIVTLLYLGLFKMISRELVISSHTFYGLNDNFL